MRQGMHVIVRSKSAGVFAGMFQSKESTLAGVAVTLLNSRRIWYWEGAASLSQLAVEGTSKPECCKFPGPIEGPHEIFEVIEIIPMTFRAVASIEAVPYWRA